MAEAVTNDGIDWFDDKAVDEHNEKLYWLAVGNGVSTAQTTDSSLDNELFEENSDASTVRIESTSNTGEIICRISITGGTEVPGGTSLTEFGVKSSRTKTLIYREDRSPINIPDGDTKIFEWKIDIRNN